MGEVIVAPDPVKLAISWFAAHGVTAVKDRPSPVDDEIVCIRRIGGATDLVVDRPWLYVECYAPADEAASDLGHLSWALLRAMAGEVIDGVPCYEFGTIAGPADMPDPDAQQPRFVMTAQLAFRATAWSPESA